MTDAFFRLVPHPLAIVTHILGQARRPLPAVAHMLLLLTFWVDWSHARELWRNLDHCLVDQHRHRIQVGSPRFNAQALRLQGNRSPAGKRIVERRHLLWIEEFFRLRVAFVQGAGFLPALLNLCPRLGKNLFVVGVLPEYQLLHDAEEPFPLGLRFLLVHAAPEAAFVTGVVDKLGEEYRSCRSKRPPGPPQMKSRRMAMPN